MPPHFLPVRSPLAAAPRLAVFFILYRQAGGRISQSISTGGSVAVGFGKQLPAPENMPSFVTRIDNLRHPHRPSCALYGYIPLNIDVFDPIGLGMHLASYTFRITGPLLLRGGPLRACGIISVKDIWPRSRSHGNSLQWPLADTYTALSSSPLNCSEWPPGRSGPPEAGQDACRDSNWRMYTSRRS